MIKLGKLRIEPSAIASQGNAILGIRDSGKTYTATLLAERLHESGVPFVAFDPIGVWRFLRVPGRGAGYPIVVAGGSDGDLPLTVAGAPEIVRAAMANGISLVIDLFDINLSKADWKRIVTACVRVLLHENKSHGLRHVFIEEAAEFAPQRIGPDQGQVYAEMEKLARMGGNSRLGYTLINQRAEEVNKALLELCDNLFLHRQKGRNSLTALTKWLDIGNVSASREIIASLPTLPTGECWAWLAGSETPELVKVPVKNSLHPDRRIMRGDEPAVATKAVDVGGFVDSMRGTLGALEKEAEANDPKKLRAEIARLTRELSAAEKRVTGVPEADVQRRIAEARRQVQSELSLRQPAGHDLNLHKTADAARKALQRIFEIAQKELAHSTKPVEEVDTLNSPASAGMPAPPFVDRRKLFLKGGGQTGSASLPAGERSVLTVIAQHPGGATREQLTVITGYKRSTRDAYLQRMRERGLVDTSGDSITVTDAGIAALGPAFEPLPTGQALRDHWLVRLPEGEARLLRILCDQHPRTVDREQLSVLTNYARSSRDAYLQRLKSRQLIVVSRDGVQASPILFD